jgi:uncharacterized protein with GYD domain
LAVAASRGSSYIKVTLAALSMEDFDVTQAFVPNPGKSVLMRGLSRLILPASARGRRGGSDAMPRYILLSTLTTEGRKTIHQHPERMQEVDNEIETFGCKVVDQYAVLGLYDFVTVVDAPDNETVAHLAVDLGSRGTVNVVTLPAISIDVLAGQLRRSEQLGHG